MKIVSITNDPNNVSHPFQGFMKNSIHLLFPKRHNKRYCLSGCICAARRVKTDLLIFELGHFINVPFLHEV